MWELDKWCLDDLTAASQMPPKWGALRGLKIHDVSSWARDLIICDEKEEEATTICFNWASAPTNVSSLVRIWFFVKTSKSGKSMEGSDERCTGVILNYLDVYGSGSYADQNCDVTFHCALSPSFTNKEMIRGAGPGFGSNCRRNFLITNNETRVLGTKIIGY